MRVIAGTLKGRRLKAPTWEGLRPTSDKLRETLFNVLAPSVVDARVLDGFAGTGALGIEAISRGAQDVTFIEHDERAVTLITDNLARAGCSRSRSTQGGSGVPALRYRAVGSSVLFVCRCRVDGARISAGERRRAGPRARAQAAGAGNPRTARPSARSPIGGFRVDVLRTQELEARGPRLDAGECREACQRSLCTPAPSIR